MPRGDVLDVDLPIVPGSRVQGGRRPAVLLLTEEAARGNPVVTVVPVTGTVEAIRFQFTFQIAPSPANGLTAPSVALVFQVMAIDRTAIARRRGHLEDEYIAQLEATLRQMFGL